MTRTIRPNRWLSIALLALTVSGCGQSSLAPRVLVDLTADGKVAQYDLYIRDDSTTPKVILLHTGWSDATKAMTRDISDLSTPLKLGINLPKPGPYTIVIIGVTGAVEPPPSTHPALGSSQFFWATSINAMADTEIAAELYHVPTGGMSGMNDDNDRDLFPDKDQWPIDVPAASVIDPTLLDCDDGTMKEAMKNSAGKIVDPALINPFAVEICGDGVDEDCNGAGDETCIDSDNDGDPDSTDCAPMDPTIHHPQLDPMSPHYDPFPESANCCGYSLGMTGPNADKSFTLPFDHKMNLCHQGTCGDGIDQDCSANGAASGDIACLNDMDCDTFPAMNPQALGCKAPPNKPSGSDCDDCDPSIHPGAPEICDGKDNNCNGLTDETCVGCDLDGDGYERNDPMSGCPDNKNLHPMMIDCNDEDSGVYPGSDKGMGGGTLLGGLRGLCRNKNPDGTPQDANCDGSGLATCPGSAMVNGKMTPCDADGDGYIDKMLIAECDPMNKYPHDCNDADPHIYPGAPDKCGDGIEQNCLSDSPCNNDKDKDGYQGADDCDDNNPAVHPWATEICDGIDNDCDMLIDELNPDATGMAMITNLAVTKCTDSSVGLCAGPHLGDCVCSASSISGLHFDVNRMACPGETPAIDAQMGGSAARCYFANQPAPQTCNPLMPEDDDCDGRVDAPDGKNFPQLGQPCWPMAQGQCAPDKVAKITGCDMTKTNCLSGFGVDKWLTCDNTTVCPVTELCNGFDDDCDGQLPANEQDLDGDAYMACGSADAMYQNMGPKACEKNLAPGLKGCGDCADAPGTTGVLKINNTSINPGQMDVCNGVDDDCNTMTPDGATDCPGGPTTLTCCGANGCKHGDTDASNCDGCGKVCALANANPVCAAASCTTMSCMAPFGDCDGNAVNGCETNLSTSVPNCNKCGQACPVPMNGLPTCTNGVCGVGSCMDPYKDCDMNPNNGCEVDDATDVNNCGGCKVVCPMVANGTPGCAAKVCGIGACTGTFSDCNHNAADGCEINLNNDVKNCQACGHMCAVVANSSQVCTNMVCQIGMCNAGFKDCNMNYADGCEINSTNDVNNCMACGNACKAVANGVQACQASQCVIGMCNGTFKDCNNNYGDGCEDDTSQDVNNCGTCLKACGNIANGVSSCVASQCAIGMCSAPFKDCDHLVGNGCEINSSNDVNNCAACGTKCAAVANGVQACQASACVIAQCNVNFADCNHNYADGCESNSTSDINNCKTCGNVCVGIAHGVPACSASTCVVASCNAPYKDCDGQEADGCEDDTSMDVNNCGSCAHQCAAVAHGTPGCTASVCVIATCNGTFKDCNGNYGDGCEDDTSSDVNNCGGCAKPCANVTNEATKACVSSACTITSCTAPFQDCNHTYLDGCEINSNTDASNCGACGNVCSSGTKGNLCLTGVCGCNANGDCLVGQPFCNTGTHVCQAASCPDGHLDGTETDLDCGGAACDAANQKCANGKLCGANADCTSGVCDLVSGKCVVSTCFDQAKDNGESDVDCGHVCAQLCANGNGCAANNDCTSGTCNVGMGKCVAGMCFDGMKDGGETDVDCGGPCVAKCPNGDGCSSGTDCTSTFCSTGHVCSTECSDGIQDGSETDIDCGGSCSKCGDGKLCSITADCSSAHCLAASVGTKRCATNPCASCQWVKNDGTCNTNVTMGDADPTGTCVVSNSNCELATCDGNGNCSPALNSVVCSNCSAGSITFCTGNALGCAGNPTLCANNFGCASMTTCKLTCNMSSDCQPNFCCHGNACNNNDMNCGTSCTDCTMTSQHCMGGGVCG